MAWTAPKTDWYGKTDDEGIYTGDRFNAEDYNRIKNNLEYLRDLAIKMYNDFSINILGADKTPKDYFYADEINEMEENLNLINNHTLQRPYGNSPSYNENGKIMDFAELNRIESATLDLYERLMNEFEGRRKFVWNFGMKGGDL